MTTVKFNDFVGTDPVYKKIIQMNFESTVAGMAEHNPELAATLKLEDVEIIEDVNGLGWRLGAYGVRVISK